MELADQSSNNMAKEIEVLKAQFVQRDYEISMNVEFPDQRNNAEKKVAALQKEQKVLRKKLAKSS